MKYCKIDNVLYPEHFFIESTAENWDNGSLGCDDRFVKLVGEIDEYALRDAVENGRIYWEDE